MEKRIPEPKGKFVCKGVREKEREKKNIKVYKKCKSPFQKGFQICITCH